MPALDPAALDQVFRTARTYSRWLDRPVSRETLTALAELMRWGPTSANSSPARIAFVSTPEGKERLRPYLMEGNVRQTMEAPVTAVVGYDTEFYERLPVLYPHADARSWFAGNPEAIEETGFRNSSLQGGYLIVAARMLGLDCGPMSGFDRAGVAAEFFPGGKIKANFLCNLGYGDPAGLHARSPRLAVEEFCSFA